MRAFLSMVVCLAACVPALAAEPAGPGQAASSQVDAQRDVQGLRPMPPAKPSPLLEPEHKPAAAALAVTVTDDADTTRLPAFAMPSSPTPKKLLRVGVEWSF
ncbi:MAG TPA: hypothetical protein VH600_23720 [Burkholderiales bacterium]